MTARNGVEVLFTRHVGPVLGRIALFRGLTIQEYDQLREACCRALAAASGDKKLLLPAEFAEHPGSGGVDTFSNPDHSRVRFARE
ncbi:MAG: hypothetical protein JRI97_03650 [Deltaproteobacteria bacterium]|nr:hypothetical protein [Deltaproteobacteria bacterium]